jgi:hypothetical protein
VSLSNEVAAQLDCLFPGPHGRPNFEQFDRLQFRLTRLLRSQLLADMTSGSMKFVAEDGQEVVQVVSGELVCTGSKVFFDRGDVDWRNATLEEYYGPFTFHQFDESLLSARFDMSQPFTEPDFMYADDEFPSPQSVTLNRQYAPMDPEKAGFDWWCVHRNTATGELVVVVTENKFSDDPEKGSSSVSLQADVIDNFTKTRKMFTDKGWRVDQLVFRLASHRYSPEFHDKSKSKVFGNLFICGEAEWKNLLSLLSRNLFNMCRQADRVS